MLCFPLNNDVNEASKSEFPFMKCIVCRLYADKRYLIRSYLSFIIWTSYNVDCYSFLCVNVLKRCFSVLLTAWIARTRLMLCESCECFVWSIGPHLAAKESGEVFVSDLPNQLVVCRNQKDFVLGIQNHLMFDETCEDFVLNIRNHLIVREAFGGFEAICKTIRKTIGLWTVSCENRKTI